MGSVHRYIAIGTDILTLSAIDFDADSVISYRTVSGNEDGCFPLDNVSGVISIGCDLNDIRVEQRDINVTATDGTHFADVMKIEIHLLSNTNNVGMIETRNYGRFQAADKNTASFQCKESGVMRRQTEIFAAAEQNNMPSNDRNSSDDLPMMPSRYGENIYTPEFIEFPNEIFINETVQLGTTITWIKARDRDLGYNGKLVYGISSGDNDSVFRLDSDDGELKIIGYLDRERQDEYVLNITIYDLGTPQKSTSKVLPVTIIDENGRLTLLSYHFQEN